MPSCRRGGRAGGRGQRGAGAGEGFPPPAAANRGSAALHQTPQEREQPPQGECGGRGWDVGLEGQRCRRPQSVGQRLWGRSWQRWRCLLLHVVWIGGVRCRMELCKETEQQRASGTKEGFADIGSQRCDCADGDTSLQGCDDCLQPTGRIHGCCCACVLLIRGSPKPGRHRAALHPPHVVWGSSATMGTPTLHLQLFLSTALCLLLPLMLIFSVPFLPNTPPAPTTPHPARRAHR